MHRVAARRRTARNPNHVVVVQRGIRFLVVGADELRALANAACSLLVSLARACTVSASARVRTIMFAPSAALILAASPIGSFSLAKAASSCPGDEGVKIRRPFNDG